jgi:hypothetical protein
MDRDNLGKYYVIENPGKLEVYKLLIPVREEIGMAVGNISAISRATFNMRRKPNAKKKSRKA